MTLRRIDNFETRDPDKLSDQLVRLEDNVSRETSSKGPLLTWSDWVSVFPTQAAYDAVLKCDTAAAAAAVGVSLPSISSNTVSRFVGVLRVGAQNVVLSPVESTALIDGAASVTLSTAGLYLYLHDGGQWHRVPADVATGGVADGDYGDITVAAGVWTIDSNVVSNADLRDSVALSVIGRSINSLGDPADIAAVAASGAVLRESGSVIGFGTVATAGLADAAVTYAKIQDVSAASRLLGRGSAAGAGDVEELTLGANLTMAGTVLSASGGGGGTFLQGTVDFGTTSPRPDAVTVSIVDAGVVALSRILVSLQTASGRDADEFEFSDLSAHVASITAGVGFDVIVCSGNGDADGQFTVNATRN